MRKNFTLFASMAFLAATSLALPASSYAQNEVDLSYYKGNDSMWRDSGYSFDDDMDISVAVKFPKSMFETYVGMQVTALKIAFGTRTYSPEVECFVRTSLDGEDIGGGSGTISCSSSDYNYWVATMNRIDLANPVTLTADMEELVIGYRFTTKSTPSGEYSIITTTTGSKKDDTQFLFNHSLSAEEGGQEWFSISKDPFIFLGAVLKDESGDMVDLCEISEMMTPSIMLIGEGTQAEFRLENKGTNNINEVTFLYTYGDQTEEVTCPFSDALKPGLNKKYIAPAFAFGTGTHTVSISKVNGNENKMAEAKEYEAIGVPVNVAVNYKMTPLVEWYCTENSHLTVPYFENIINPGFEMYKNDIVFVLQHMDDQFMQFDFEEANEYDDATTRLLEFASWDFDKVAIPCLTANRSLYANALLPDVATTVDYTNIYSTFIGSLYDPALNTPTFVSVNAEAEVNKETLEGEVKIEGYLEDGILPEGEVAYLTVYLMEDGVESTSQEMPDDEDILAMFPDGKYIQRYVIRNTLTRRNGDPINTGKFEKSIKFEVDEDFDLNNMSVVAFVNRAYTGPTQLNVLNATETPLKIGSGVISLGGTSKSVEYYDLQGRKVTSAENGLFIRRTILSTGDVRTEKVIVK